MAEPRDPAADLDRIAFLLERDQAPTYRVSAFRNAQDVVLELGTAALADRVAEGTLQQLRGIGKTTSAIITESLAGTVPAYLGKVEAAAKAAEIGGGADLLAALRGDLHTHSDWSDGGAPIARMAATGRALGHEYMVLTDHSPRLTVANGLSRERLLDQLDVVAEVNEQFAPFRLLTGIEVDILDDGTLDQDDDLLERLDVVVASVHSVLRMPAQEMTPRMVAAIANPHTDVLGHMTGRMVTGNRSRPESSFDHEVVLAACERFGVAVEINSRPERLDPPRRILRDAVDAGCLFTVDTDAHAPGQLDWQWRGAARAAECGVPADRVVDTWPVADLLAWTADHWHRPAAEPAGTPTG